MDRLDKSKLRRLRNMVPPIDADVLADTLCDGELLAVVLDRWVNCDFTVEQGILFNRNVKLIPSTAEIVDTVKRLGAFEAEVRLTECFDFQILNDPACPPEVMYFVMSTLARLWEAQARREFPERDVQMELKWNPDEGFGAYSILQRSLFNAPHYTEERPNHQ